MTQNKYSVFVTILTIFMGLIGLLFATYEIDVHNCARQAKALGVESKYYEYTIVGGCHITEPLFQLKTPSVSLTIEQPHNE